MTYPEAIAYTQSLLKFGMDFGLGRMAELLERLGNPQLRYRHVHIAGTNGKGSTTAFSASVLKEAGYRVGRYMSPHVYDLRERFVMDGHMISPTDFAHTVSQIKPYIEALAASSWGQTTEFELLTAVAFQYFAQQGVEFAVLEVGLGGRLDSTNIIPAPMVAVITQIGLDHQAILGHSLAEIAAEKAGILKQGTVCLTGVERPEALKTIAGIAERLEVLVYAVGESTQPVGFESKESALEIYTPLGKLEGIKLGLSGPFQATNAALAAGIAWQLSERGVAISLEAVRRGLEGTRLPGRFEIVRMNNGQPLILDVAHNADGAKALNEALEQSFPGQRFHFVVGMTAAHDPAEFLPILSRKIASLGVIEPPFRPRAKEDVLAAAARLQLPAQTFPTLTKALEGLEATQQGAVVTGSFYTVAELPKAYRGFEENP